MKSLAIVVVHGIGRQVPLPPDKPYARTFSDKLYARVQGTVKRLGGKGALTWFWDDVVWRECHYAHVFNDLQAAYFSRIGQSVRPSRLRRLVVDNLADAAAYRPGAQTRAGPYEAVHACVRRTLLQVEDEVSPEAPLIILAHSLGGHVISNYLWDAQVNGEAGTFAGGSRLATFITFGCNIPLFLMGCDPEAIRAIRDPASDSGFDRREPWWRNYYDRDDALGYPLASLGGDYSHMAAKGALSDHAINAGNLLTRWNTLSHNGYWTSRALAEPVAQTILAHA